MSRSRILLTGAAGFIGAHVAQALLARGDEVLGADNLSPYYPPQLKRDRLAALAPGLELRVVDLAERAAVEALFAEARPQVVLHLAAQPGVRHSLIAPYDYVSNNLIAFVHLLEACRTHRPAHFVFASTSSVYGDSRALPFAETASIQRPLSLYSASKGANELMAHSYAHLFGIPSTALRFFTVYGPWGRPDMAPILFTRAILAGRPIQVFNGGDLRRDFTYVADIVDGVLGALDAPPAGKPGTTPFQVYNLGAGRPVELPRFIAAIEAAVGRPAIREPKPMQPGDMYATYADTRAAQARFGYAPKVGIEQGVPELVRWCAEYYGAAA